VKTLSRRARRRATVGAPEGGQDEPGTLPTPGSIRDLAAIGRACVMGTDYPTTTDYEELAAVERTAELRAVPDGFPGEIESWSDGHAHRFVPMSIHRDAVAEVERLRAQLNPEPAVAAPVRLRDDAQDEPGGDILAVGTERSHVARIRCREHEAAFVGLARYVLFAKLGGAS
jgi:hypothetical protein